ncbi:MAG: hypothetical protein K2I64_03110 [Muribaculaceae bacterium]|nr:hypothetical protein [Muribaculaceae bacterium]
MTKILSQNYSYANNSSNELIKVSTAQRNEKYFCPVCGELMIPHMGKIRRWHFVHKNTENCSYESYLHLLAKFKIRETFLKSEHFLLSYKAKALCSHECPFITSPKCEDEKPVQFDLRRYYDKCEIEASYYQYRADLLLSSSTNSNRPPVLIEIRVTHKCTEDKINSGARIIEIPIQSEEQIDHIVESGKLKAVRANQFSHLDENKITLYNFNKIESFDPIGSFDEDEEYFSRKNTIVFWLNQQGKFCSFDCHCYEVRDKLPPNVHYYITQIATPFKEIFQEFSKRGVKIRNCFLCKFSKQDYWGDWICILYKRLSLPRKPSPYSATSCSNYMENFMTSQNAVSIAHPQNTEQSDSTPPCKFYYHICEDIL